jgi:hypothetical protein
VFTKSKRNTVEKIGHLFLDRKVEWVWKINVQKNT